MPFLICRLQIKEKAKDHTLAEEERNQEVLGDKVQDATEMTNPVYPGRIISKRVEPSCLNHLVCGNEDTKHHFGNTINVVAERVLLTRAMAAATEEWVGQQLEQAKTEMALQGHFAILQFFQKTNETI